MGDNFRQSLEDIRVGYRDAAPRVSVQKEKDFINYKL